MTDFAKNICKGSSVQSCAKHHGVMANEYPGVQ